MWLDRRLIAAATFAYMFVLAGCGGQADEPAGFAETDPPDTAAANDPSSASTPSRRATTQEAEAARSDAELEVESDPPDGPDAEIFEAYVAYWEATVEAGTVPDPEHGRLLTLAADPQRERIVSSLEDMQHDGERFAGTFRISPSVVSVTGPVAHLEDCTDGRDSYHIDASGAEVADSRGSLNAVDVELVAEAGGWVVADIQRASNRECPTE